MHDERKQFLTTMIKILDKLHESSVQKDEPMLASMLAIAKGEAEDSLRHADGLAALEEQRERLSSAHSWRPADQQAEGARDGQIAA